MRSGPWLLVASVLAASLALHCASDPEAPQLPAVYGGTGGAPAGGGSGSGGAPPAGGTGGGFASGGAAAPGGTGGGGQPIGNGGSGGIVDSGGVPGPNTNPGFKDLSPPLGAPLTPDGATALTPPAPTGWAWFPIEGAVCRDGSPTGIFVHFTQGDALYIYLEGGGACSSSGFCNFNPKNKDQVLGGNGETVLGSAAGAVAGRQQPGVYEGNVLKGIFDTTNAENPFKDWNGVYVPYCTGDVHFGTNENATVPGIAEPQKFVGYRNMEKIIGRVVPTFQGKVNRVVLTGSSAGGFGAALNFSMVQDAFKDVRVDVLDDSGPPFENDYMPVCMQKRWRDLWGYEGALPEDCTECRDADGGNLVKLADFLLRKHPNATVALVSGTEDEIIRLFFSTGLQSCANFQTADPVAITLGQADPTIYMPAATYTAGLNALKTQYVPTGRFATYLIGAGGTTPPNLHQHLWRDRFYQPVSQGKSMARFVSDWLGGKIQQVGP